VASAIAAVPNPFNPQTAISFTTTRAGQVTARIYDVSGQLIRTLNDGIMAGGSHSLIWNGSMENGRLAAAGIYFLKLRSPDGESAKRLVFMR
jgi:flagellar hook assembly protein FlgD